jgi:hypothetical protein
MNTTEATWASFVMFSYLLANHRFGIFVLNLVSPLVSFCQGLGNDGPNLVLLALLHPRTPSRVFLGLLCRAKGPPYMRLINSPRRILPD